ncbi:tetratricopeptide repeat protein [Myxosarcina sp. GI1(2024)]
MGTKNSSNHNLSSSGRASFRAVILLGLLLSSVIWLSFYLVTQYRQLKLYQQANRSLQEQRYRQAVLAYDRLLQTNLQDNYRLWLSRGYALKGLGQYEAMLQSCSQANEIAPQEPLGWNCQGEALYNLEKYQMAANAFERAVTLAPQTVTFWLNKSEALLNAKDYEAAERDAQQAASLLESNREPLTGRDRQFAIVYNLQGKIFLARKQELQALLAFERSLTKNPKYFAAALNKGISLYRLKRSALADEVWQNILQQNSITPEQETITRVYRGIAFCDTQNIAAAERDFAKVLELSSDRQMQEMARAGCGIQ